MEGLADYHHGRFHHGGEVHKWIFDFKPDRSQYEKDSLLMETILP